MNLGMYGILIVFALFIILLIFFPQLSCFGRCVRSPFCPILHKKKHKKIETSDYGFSLVDDSKKKEVIRPKKKVQDIKTQGYGFNLTASKEEQKTEREKGKDTTSENNDVHTN